jgi:hypothetical protein
MTIADAAKGFRLIRGAKLNPLSATLRESEVFGEWDVIVQ